MSLYEKKLEKLEELAGLHECSHPHALTFIAPPWFTPEGEEPFSWTMCRNCKTNLHRTTPPIAQDELGDGAQTAK